MARHGCAVHPYRSVIKDRSGSVLPFDFRPTTGRSSADRRGRQRQNQRMGVAAQAQEPVMAIEGRRAVVLHAARDAELAAITSTKRELAHLTGPRRQARSLAARHTRYRIRWP